MHENINIYIIEHTNIYSSGQKNRKMRFFELILYFESKSKIEISYSIVFITLIPNLVPKLESDYYF